MAELEDAIALNLLLAVLIMKELAREESSRVILIAEKDLIVAFIASLSSNLDLVYHLDSFAVIVAFILVNLSKLALIVTVEYLLQLRLVYLVNFIVSFVLLVAALLLIVLVLLTPVQGISDVPQPHYRRSVELAQHRLFPIIPLFSIGSILLFVIIMLISVIILQFFTAILLLDLPLFSLLCQP